MCPVIGRSFNPSRNSLTVFRANSGKVSLAWSSGDLLSFVGAFASDSDFETLSGPPLATTTTNTRTKNIPTTPTPTTRNGRNFRARAVLPVAGFGQFGSAGVVSTERGGDE